MVDYITYDSIKLLVITLFHLFQHKILLFWRYVCMKTVNIKLTLAENVKNFVNIVSKYPYEIDLRSGRHVIDAKSILGIFSLDLSKPVIVEVYSDDCDDFMDDIKSFIV